MRKPSRKARTRMAKVLEGMEEGVMPRLTCGEDGSRTPEERVLSRRLRSGLLDRVAMRQDGGDAAYPSTLGPFLSEDGVASILHHPASKAPSRRTFLKGCAAAFASMALGGLGGSLSGCSFLQGNLRTITDMGGREVAVPEEITRLFCSNPIGTVDMYLLDPSLLVGWNFRPTGDNRKYIPEVYLNLPSLGVWMGSGATPNDEEIVRQDPQVILCYWTCDEVGIKMADDVRNETGMPVLLVDYDLRAAPEMYRYVGELVNRVERAEELATYCEEKLAAIRQVTDSIPEDERKSVYLAQGVGGLSTDPVGSMHVTDALELIGTRNVVDMPGAAGQGMGMPTVSLEQIIQWDPDAVLVSEYSMSDSESSDLYDEIRESSEWQLVPCVREGKVYRMPQSPFAWFGRPPSVVRVLGCMLLQKVLYPEYTQDVDMVAETQAFYELFYRMELSEGELASILETADVSV